MNVHELNINELILLCATWEISVNQGTPGEVYLFGDDDEGNEGNKMLLAYINTYLKDLPAEELIRRINLCQSA